MKLIVREKRINTVLDKKMWKNDEKNIVFIVLIVIVIVIVCVR